MIKHNKKNIVIIFIFCSIFGFSQQERKQSNDTLDTDVVNIVKPYAPKVSDAFKIREIPSLNDKVTNSKKKVKYTIFSIPVASTFTPAKAKAAAIDKQKKIKLYDNFASLGFGSYTTVLADLYLNHSINATEYIGGYLSHHSSQGGIDNVLLDNNFSDSDLNINYGNNLKDLSWNIDLGFQHQLYNWYGISSLYSNESLPININPMQTYYTINLGGEVDFYNSSFNHGSARFIRFFDDYDSSENRVLAKTNFDIQFDNEQVNTEISFDYLDGKFASNYYTAEAIKYGNFNIGISPNYQFKKNDFTINIGISAYYFHDNQAKDNKFYIYPKVTASYNLVSEILIPYAGVEGGLKQNSYRDFVTQNPFVSPSLLIGPTDEKYNAYAGLKGVISSNVSYNLKGSYYAENDKPLFKNNSVLNTTDPENYNYGNSFGLVYDDVRTLSVFGELNVDFNRNFTLALSAEYFNYSTDVQDEAWNLPDFKASLFVDYQITEQWFLGANIYYFGQRKDQETIEGGIVGMVTNNYNLESYFDANAHLGYRINEKISVLAKVNNVTNQSYQRWLNFPVQGIQIVAGATYKFDF